MTSNHGCNRGAYGLPALRDALSDIALHDLQVFP